MKNSKILFFIFDDLLIIKTKFDSLSFDEENCSNKNYGGYYTE
jgi:hypothetical protein